MKRREFLAGGGAMGLTAVLPLASGTTEKKSFNLVYAPHFGLFTSHAGEDLIDQLNFIEMLSLEMNREEKTCEG